jgi:hypothetical protein
LSLTRNTARVFLKQCQGEVVLKVTCGSCGKSVKSSDAWAGRSAKCPNCNAAIVFPAIDQSPPATGALVDRGPAGAGAERAATVAKSPTGNVPSSAGDATLAREPAGRKCPCCGQSTPANVANCVHCGEFLGLAAEKRSAAGASLSQPSKYDDFEVSATSEANLVARLAGLLMVLIPIGGLVYEACRKHTFDEGDSPILYGSLISLVILGGPGVYLAIKGALGGPRAQKNRARGMVQFLSGLGVIAFGVGLTLVVMWIGIVLGAFAIVFVGMIGSGAIMAAMGFAALISGRDLKTELSEINLFGGG